jgi:NTP pyrophosphatase (non-canonical NTP hydrolase)
VLTREEKLVLLIEECGEVIQAATKCLRFGWDRDHPGYGCNKIVLAGEVGDLLGVIDSLPLNNETMSKARAAKMVKAERAKLKYGSELTT